MSILTKTLVRIAKALNVPMPEMFEDVSNEDGRTLKKQGNRGYVCACIKEITREKGFSQGELSRRANIDENTLKCIYKNPTAVITTETLDKLAKALGMDASVLIESVPE